MQCNQEIHGACIAGDKVLVAPFFAQLSKGKPAESGNDMCIRTTSISKSSHQRVSIMKSSVEYRRTSICNGGYSIIAGIRSHD